MDGNPRAQRDLGADAENWDEPPFEATAASAVTEGAVASTSHRGAAPKLASSASSRRGAVMATKSASSASSHRGCVTAPKLAVGPTARSKGASSTGKPGATAAPALTKPTKTLSLTVANGAVEAQKGKKAATARASYQTPVSTKKVEEATSTESSEAFPLAQVEPGVPPPPSETPVEAGVVHIEESLNRSQEEVARSAGNMHEGGLAPAGQDLSDLFLSALDMTEPAGAPDAPAIPPAEHVVAPTANTVAPAANTVAPADPALAGAEAPPPIIGAVTNPYRSNADWVGGHIRPILLNFLKINLLFIFIKRKSKLTPQQPSIR